MANTVITHTNDPSALPHQFLFSFENQGAKTSQISRAFPTNPHYFSAPRPPFLPPYALSCVAYAMYHPNQPHIAPATPGASSFSSSVDFNKPVKKQRGNYNCGRCGLPKKGHSCHLPPAATCTPTSADSSASVSTSKSRSLPPSRQQFSHLRRALSFDDIDIRCDSPQPEMDESELDLLVSGSGKLPASCMWEVLKRLPPAGLLAAATVCKGWRDTARRLWRAAEELRLRVPPTAQLGFVGSVLQKCPGLVRLSLRMERLGLLSMGCSDSMFYQI